MTKSVDVDVSISDTIIYYDSERSRHKARKKKEENVTCESAIFNISGLLWQRQLCIF